MGSRSKLLFILAAFLWLVPATIRAATFTASLDRGTITLGESASLSLTFEGGSPNDVPKLPSIPNLRIDYVGPSTQFSFINGETRNTVTHIYNVNPLKIGDYTIPAVTIQVGNQKLETQPVTLKVLKPGATAAGGSGQDLAMLRLVLPKNEVYLGEVLVAELQIYLHSSVQNFGNIQLTSFPSDGFNVGKFVEGQRRSVQSGNSVYTMIPYSVPLTPVKAGQWTIGPLSLSFVVELAGRRRDPFRDPFLDPFGMRGEQKSLTLATDPQTVQVLQLPSENVPANFKGAVGSYTLTLSATPTNVAVGDPITVRVQISGRGSLDAITLPEQTDWHDFKTYPPTAKVETSDQLGIQGTKTFEMGVVPQSAEVNALPSFSFCFFDPDTKGYRTLTEAPVPLTIRPGATTVVPTIAAASSGARDNPPLTHDIIPIKQRLGTVAMAGPPLMQQPAFLALQSAPVLALLFSVFWRKRNESLANNPRLRRQRHVAQLIRTGLNELQKHASANKSDEFFATLSRLLQERLGERLDVPANSITEAVVEERLQPKGVPEPTVSALRELFQTCNLARYAPVKDSRELAALIPKLERVLDELEEVKP